jgi:hypothetical protein
VTFESGSLLSGLGKSAFLCCSSLSSMCIPSSVEVLREGCFYGCTALSNVTFESGSTFSFVPVNCRAWSP